MKVYGYEIHEGIISAASSWAQRNGGFSARELASFLRDSKVPEDDGIAMRAADRIIDRFKRSGLISLKRGSGGPFWTWCGGVE